MMPADALPIICAAGGIFGAFLRAATSKDHPTFSKETLGNCFVGAVMGVMWLVPIGGWWPPIELTATASPLTTATIVAFSAYAAADVVATRGVGWLRALISSKLPDGGSGGRS